MAFFNQMNKHVVKYRMAYFAATVILLALIAFLKGFSSIPASQNMAVVTFTVVGDSVIALHLKGGTQESTQELIVRGVHRFEKQIEIDSEVHLKWYTLNPGHPVKVDINQGVQVLEQERGEWTFIVESKPSCFISTLSI